MLIGQTVLYHPGDDQVPGGKRCDQPHAAMVVKDNEDGTVSLLVFSHTGDTFLRPRVVFSDTHTAESMAEGSKHVPCCCPVPSAGAHEAPKLGSAGGTGGAVAAGGRAITSVPTRFAIPDEEQADPAPPEPAPVPVPASPPSGASEPADASTGL